MVVIAFCGRGVTLTTHIHLSPTLWMSRALPVLPFPLPSAFITLYGEILRTEGRVFLYGGLDTPRGRTSTQAVSGFQSLCFLSGMHIYVTLCSLSVPICIRNVVQVL